LEAIKQTELLMKFLFLLISLEAIFLDVFLSGLSLMIEWNGAAEVNWSSCDILMFSEEEKHQLLLAVSLKIPLELS